LYLTHSHVHNDQTVPIITVILHIFMHETVIFPLPVLNLTSPSCLSTRFSLIRKNFGNLAINKGYIAYFHGTCSKRPDFYFRSEIWRHHRVPRPRFPARRENFGDSRTFKADVGLLHICMDFHDLLV